MNGNDLSRVNAFVIRQFDAILSRSGDINVHKNYLFKALNLLEPYAPRIAEAVRDATNGFLNGTFSAEETKLLLAVDISVGSHYSWCQS